MKILSPAGNMQSLKMAVYNGADEVYVGINDYNARNNIDGFTLDSLKNAVDFAHLYSVRVLLAINVLFTDEELNQAINTLISAYNLGVDAFIIQDLALAEIVSKTYPQIELHASTQMAIHNLEGVRFLERFNFKRVVLARETPLKEIKRIRQNSDIEIEYFVQGALCVSFSGNCYLSSYMFGASGNRGRCKQPCRLPYTLRYNGKNLKTGYLLSAKDFNMSLRLEDLKKAGVDCIKIEGRARRPYYVAMATREYYNAIHNKPVNQNNLKLAFNRSYVEGYFNGNGNIISKLQNHAGIYIGEVSAVEIGNKFNKVYIKSDKKIAPKSVLKFLHNDKEMGVITAFDIKDSQDGFMVTTTQKLNKGYSVHLISDAFSEEQALSYTAKIKIDLVVEFCLNKKAKVTASIKDNVVCHQSEFILESAKNSPLTQQELADCFNKNEYFDCQIKVSELDGVFVAKSMLNGFRRDFFDKLINQITQKYYRNVKAIKIQKPSQINTFSDFVYVNKITKKVSQKNVIYSPQEYDLKDIIKFTTWCKQNNKNAYLDTPNFALKEDIEILSEIIKKANVGVVANNYYALGLSKNTVIGGGLNVYNSHTAKVLNLPIIVAEGEQVKYKFPYMTLRHCPIKSHVGGSCSDCKYKDGYEYLMENKKVLSLTRKKLTSCTFYLVDKQGE